MADKLNILGVDIAKLTKPEALAKIKQFLSDNRQHQIVTPNPEFLLTASQDEEFFYILNRADLALADGFGLKIAAWLQGQNLIRITGADLVKDILKLAQTEKLKVMILNWRGGLSSALDLEQGIKVKFFDLALAVADISRDWRQEDFKTVLQFKPQVIFVNLGAPDQEKLIFHQLPNWPSVKLALGVGGALDFLSGRIKRAPGVLRIIGLEWLWRLIKQPRRWPRIYRAVIIFPWRFFSWRFIQPWLYRPSVVCLLYRREGGQYKILIVARAEDPHHWQLPQGGLDGQSLEAAGRRELAEELNCRQARVAASYKNLYKYRFPSFALRSWGYRGQKQGLLMAEFLGPDSEIKINYWDHSGWKWVDSESLAAAVHPVRRRATEIYLEKFRQLAHKL